MNEIKAITICCNVKSKIVLSETSMNFNLIEICINKQYLLKNLLH